MLKKFNPFAKNAQRADLALQFLQRLRPRSPWIFVSEGHGAPAVESFLPSNRAELAAARSRIIGWQRSSKGVMLLVGDTAQPLNRPFTEEEIVSSSIIAIELPGEADKVRASLAAIPEPSAVINTGRAHCALYVTHTPLPIGVANQLGGSLARRASGKLIWLLPLPSTIRPNGREVRIVHHHPGRLFGHAYLAEKAQPRSKKIVRASDVAPANVRWIWRHMIPEGELTLIAGFGSAGKTTMCLSLAAAISRGSAWPDGTAAPLGRALVIEGEDPTDTVTVPRLLAAGAKLERITLVDQGGDMLTARDLEEASAGLEDLKLVVLSPIRRLIHDTQATNTEIRRRLEPLIEWARGRKVGLIGIMHPQKGNKAQSADAFAGSPAYTELSRMSHLATIDDTDTEPSDLLKRRKLVSVKTNIAPAGISYGYRIESAEVNGLETSRVSWLTPGATRDNETRETQPEQTASFPIRSPAPQTPPPAAVYPTACSAWLAKALEDGPLLADDAVKMAKGQGFSRATVYRAATFLGVRRETVASGKKQWRRSNG